MFGNFSWITLGTVFSTILRAVTLLLLVRFSSPADFAMYAGTYGLLVFGKAISDLGLTKLIIRDRALDPKSNLYGQALRLNTLTSALLGALGTVGLLVVAIVGMSFAWVLVPMAASAALEKNADTWRSVHLADGDAHLVALYTLARRVVTLMLFAGLVFWSPTGPILSMTLAELVAALLSMLAVRMSVGRIIHPPRALNIRSTLAAGRPFWIHGLAMQSRNLDVSIVAFFAPVTQSGYFAAATRLSGPLQLIPSSLASVLLPHTARTQSSEKSGAGRVIWFATLLFIPVCGLLASFVPAMVPILIGDDYIGAVLCIQIIILGIPLSVYANLTSEALQGEGFARELSRLSWSYAFVLLVAVAAGAGFWGANGAAIGTVLANCFLVAVVAYLWIQTRKRAGG
ncbi:MAG: oligosaccharide flippase family protein [Yaniella sp.]|nr:oligosaccharide flippase family protein [Yaniella sp.]